MPGTKMRFFFIIIFHVMIYAGNIHAQRSGTDRPQTASMAKRPVLQAIPISRPPAIDGEVVADPAWQDMPAAKQFWQTTPDEGAPASQRTEVRVAYTADTLYFGVMCYDEAPEKIIVSDSRRDASLDETDCFQIILDTYHDGQNGFVFGSNPAGIEYDAQVTNEGRGGFRGGRQRGGSAGGFNINWDGAWKVRAKIVENGWSAEFAIPFRTLRYKKTQQQRWGVNFQRNIRRRKERAFWAALPRQYNLHRLSLAGTLEGLNIRPQRNLKLMPYVLVENVRDYEQEADFRTDQELGADLKYSISPSLTLDLTANPDFAQVEVDEQQINLDRFNLFFPEKRPFFLENAGFFSVGSPGEVEMFFSRRIGLTSEGAPVPILGGGRLSGKLAGANIGLLNIQTRAVGDTVQANNFTVARVQKEFRNRSAIGGILINRARTGEIATDEGEYNRTFAVDGRLGLGQNGDISGYAAGSAAPGTQRDTYAFKIGASYNSKAWLLSLNLTQVGAGFDPQVGFLRRSAFIKRDGMIMYRYRPQSFLGLHELRPHISYRGFWKFSGFQESGFLHIDNHWEWKNGYEFHTGLNFTREGVVEAFDLEDVPVPRGTYDHAEAQLVFITNQGAPVSLNVRTTIGGYFGGDRLSVSSTLRLRRGEALTADIRWSRNDIDLPDGSFVTNLLRARVSYSFTPRISLQALIQYNDSADLWSTNLRFNWLQTANSGLFLVYNENRDLEHEVISARDRSVILKYARLFDVL